VKVELIPYSVLGAEENMALDRRMAERSEREGVFLFRWYGWAELSVSLGYSQCRLKERLNFPLKKVCRPTGGGLLLHGWDLSFALTTPSGFFKNSLHLYRFVSSLFLKTLRDLGINADYSRKKRGNYLRSPYCWDFPTFGEITLNGKKFLAAAVRDFGDGNFLIHGSIFVHLNGGLLKKFFPDGEVGNKVATLSEAGIKKSTLKKVFTRRLKKEVKLLLS